MFGWFTAKAPLSHDDRRWIEARWGWLLEQFGPERLLHLRVVLPTDDFFPDPYDGTEQAAARLFHRVCHYLGVDPRRVELDFFSESHPAADALLVRTDPGAAGVYDAEEGRTVIWLETSALDDALSVVATLAHELAHVHLLGDGRLTADQPDHEPLTDLLVVFLGLGIFLANTEVRDARGWGVGRQGYLTGPMFGYALALFAHLRGERRPDWARYLRLDVRSYLRQSLRYLARHGHGPFTPDGAPAYPPAAYRLPPPPEDEPEEDQLDQPDDQEHVLPGLKPGSSDAHMARAVLLASEGRYEDAVLEYTQALRLEPHDAEIHQLRGRALLELGEFRAALADAREAIALEPDDLEAYRVRGAALQGLGHYREALEDFNLLVSQDKRDADALYRRGQTQAARGAWRQAVADFSRALIERPRWAEIYLARAQAYEQLGQFDQALADRQQASLLARS